MRITRRQFIKYISAAGASLGLSELQIFKLTEAMAKVGGGPRVQWLQGQPCNGCTMAFADLFHAVNPDAVGLTYATGSTGAIQDVYGTAVERTLSGASGLLGWTETTNERTTDVADILLDVIDLEYHQTLMNTAGYAAIESLMTASSGFILAIEGAIPADGTYVVGQDASHIGVSGYPTNTGVPMADAVKLLAPQAAAVVCVGQCAAFGGWPSARNKKWESHESMQPVAQPNKYRSSGAKSVPDFLSDEGINTPYVRVSGCPMRAEELYLVVAQALVSLGGLVASFDAWNRPTKLFGVELYNKPIHNRCVNKNDFLNGRFATEWGQDASGSANGGCLAKLGCKGPSSWRSCQRVSGGVARGQWNALNNTVSSDSTLFPGSSCINAGAQCMACGEAGYPDRFSHPLVSYTGYDITY